MIFSRRKFISTNAILAAGVKLGLSFTPKNTKETFTVDFLGSDSDFEKYQSVFKQLKNYSFALENLHLNRINSSGQAGNDSKAAIVYSPLRTRSADAADLLNAGKHVIIRQPVGITLKDYDNIMNAAGKNNLKAGTFNIPYFMEAVVIANKVYLHKEIGNINHFDITISPAFAGQEEGHLGFGSHLTNLLSWYTGDSIHSLKSGFNKTALPHVNNPNINFQAELKNQTISYTAKQGIKSWKFVIIGDKGKVILTGENTAKLIDNQRIEREIYNTPVPLENRIILTLANFFEACTRDKEPEINLLEGLHAITLNQALVKAQITGKKVRLIEKSGMNEAESGIWNI